MFVQNVETVIEAGSVPLTAITADWFGMRVESPPAFGFAIDPGHLHFHVTRSAPARMHPDAQPGDFTANLWQYDAAEFFLVHPDCGRYLEFNLASNGAWWSCEFTAPRQRARPDDIPFPDVITGGLGGAGSWEATASLPLASLRERFAFGPRTRLNATFTLLSPGPLFLTATPLGPGEPDFHQPDRLQLVEFQQA
jgi:hypothetical protein